MLINSLDTPKHASSRGQFSFSRRLALLHETKQKLQLATCSWYLTFRRVKTYNYSTYDDKILENPRD